MNFRSPLNKTALASILLASPLSSTLAAENQWYVSPMLSYIQADDNRNADNDFGLHLGLGKQVSDLWNLEVSAVADTLDAEVGSGEYKQRGLIVDGVYFFQRDNDLSIYGVAGIGALRTKLADDSDTNLTANVGLGLMKPVNQYFSIRTDVRYRMDNDDRVNDQDRFGDWLLNVGLYIPFGGKSTQSSTPSMQQQPEPVAETIVAPSEPIPQVVDTDGDGVEDGKDNCPNTNRGISVNASGCELDNDADGIVNSKDSCPNTATGAKVDSRGCELDSDNDGVVNSQDRCANTPSNTTVNSTGCIPDSDNDGIADNMDRCPTSSAGVQVDSKGCELQQVIVLKGVTFETGSARITATSETELTDVANTLRKYSSMTLEVSGHTDNRGAESINQRLSGQRAQAVVDHLVAQGIQADRLQAKGYGSSKPIANNNSAEGRSQNRRVELNILKR